MFKAKLAFQVLVRIGIFHKDVDYLEIGDKVDMLAVIGCVEKSSLSNPSLVHRFVHLYVFFLFSNVI